MTDERIAELAEEIYIDVLQYDARQSYLRDIIREILIEESGGVLAGEARWKWQPELASQHFRMCHAELNLSHTQSR